MKDNHTYMSVKHEILEALLDCAELGLLLCLTSIRCFQGEKMPEKERRKIKEWREGNAHVVYIEAETDKQRNRVHLPQLCWTQRIIYLHLNVSLNIHPAALFHPALSLLICFLLLPPWLTKNHLYVNVRERLDVIVAAAAAAVFTPNAHWETDGETEDKAFHYRANGSKT